MLTESVKLALRIKTDAFDDEIRDLAEDCLTELKGLGVFRPEEHVVGGICDSQIKSAVIFYCKWKFGSNPDAERWGEIYHDKVTKLMVMTGYGIPTEE